MELIISYTSPYARKVRILRLEGNIPCQEKEMVPWLTAESEELNRINPLRKVPILSIRASQILFDSKLICQYFDEHFLNGRFFSDSADKNPSYQKLNQALLAEGLLDALTAITQMDKVIEDQPDRKVPSAWTEWQQAKVKQTLHYFDSHPDYAPAKTQPNTQPNTKWNSMADVTLACALGYIDFRFQEKEHIDWRDHHPNLRRIYAEWQQIPSYAQTAPPPVS